MGTNKFGGESVTYEGVGSTKKWERIESYGPKFVEDVYKRQGPDACKLRIIQRRAAFFRFLQELLMGFLCIPQPLDDPASIVGHGLWISCLKKWRRHCLTVYR